MYYSTLAMEHKVVSVIVVFPLMLLVLMSFVSLMVIVFLTMSFVIVMLSQIRSQLASLCFKDDFKLTLS